MLCSSWWCKRFYVQHRSVIPIPFFNTDKTVGGSIIYFFYFRAGEIYRPKLCSSWSCERFFPKIVQLSKLLWLLLSVIILRKPLFLSV